MQNYLLYDTSEGMHNTNECRYALLRLLAVYNLKPPPDLSVVVHSAHPRLFDGFLTFFPQFEIKDPVIGPHAGKEQVIQSFFSCPEYQGNLLFCDTATFPLQPLDALFGEIEKGQPIFYQQVVPETNGIGSIPKQIQAIITQSQHRIDDLPERVEDVPVFSTAVIGMNHNMLGAVKRSGEMINRLFQQIDHPLAQKFAFSHAFQKLSPIKTANDYFADYFGLNEFRALLHTFFSKNEEESIPNLVKLSQLLDVAAIQQEKAKFNRQPLLKKWWKSLTGKGWSLRKYEERVS